MAEQQIKMVSETKETLYALQAIREKYPKIRTFDIERFAPVYYPIAVMEMDLSEQTFEDFETVQLTVLKAYRWGMKNPDIIADSLGLSRGYIENVLRLLTGYGHIENGYVTEVGERSLAAGKKIIVNKTRQRFQTDALNGTLLRLSEKVINNAICEKGETNKYIGHLSYPEGIPESYLIDQLAGEKCSEYLHYRSDILHANVTDISGVRCKELQYAKAYLLKLKSHKAPMVFAKRYDRTVKDINDRFSWQPFSVADDSYIRNLGFYPDTHKSSDYAKKYTESIYSMMLDRSREKPLEAEEALLTLSKALPIAAERVTPRITSASTASVLLSADSFTRYNGTLFELLNDLGREKGYIVTTKQLGCVITVAPDAELQQAASLLARRVDEKGVKEVRNALKESFSEAANDTRIFDVIFSALGEL